MGRLNYDEEFSVGGKTFTVALTDHFFNEELDPGTTHFHAHPGCEVQLVVGGGGTLVLRGEKRPLRGGDLVLIAPGEKHRICPDAGKELKRITFMFFMEDRKPGERLSDGLFSVFRTKTPCIVRHGQGELMKDEEALRREFRERGPCMREAVRAYLAVMMIHIARALSGAGEEPAISVRTADGQSNRAQLIEDYLSSAIGRNVSCGELAGKLGLSERQVERAFRELYGSTFRRMVIQVRMEAANSLFEEGGHSAEEVARRVGYQSVNAFYAAYRACFGMTPGEFRKTAGLRESDI